MKKNEFDNIKMIEIIEDSISLLEKLKMNFDELEKIKEESKKNIEELDLLYIATANFSTQLSARINAETKKAFEELCAEKYPNVPIAKLVSLALKEFTENHK